MKTEKAKRLKEIGLTQQEFSRMLNWSRQKLIRYFNGRVKKFTEREIKILKKYGIWE